MLREIEPRPGGEMLDGHRSLYFRDPAGNSVELAPPSLWNGIGYRTAEAIPPAPDR